MKRLGFADKEKLWQFVRTQERILQPETWNGKPNASGRQCIWYGIGCELGFHNQTFTAAPIPQNLRNRATQIWGGDDWNSILIYKYEAGVELKRHIDRQVFHPRTIIINISTDNLFGGDIEFEYGDFTEILSHGEIIEFNNQIPHAIRRVSQERWSISIRKIIE